LIERIIRFERFWWTGHTTQMGKAKKTYRILVRKPSGKWPLERLKRSEVVKVNIREISCEVN
jgi:hypothetical protein